MAAPIMGGLNNNLVRAWMLDPSWKKEAI